MSLLKRIERERAATSDRSSGTTQMRVRRQPAVPARDAYLDLKTRIQNKLIVRHSVFVIVQILSQHISSMKHFVITHRGSCIHVNAKDFNMLSECHIKLYFLGRHIRIVGQDKHTRER